MLLVEQRHCHVSKVEATQVPDSLTPGILANPFARAAKSPGFGKHIQLLPSSKASGHQKARQSFHQNASSGIIFRQHFCNALLRVGQRSNASVLCKPQRQDFLLHGQRPTGPTSSIIFVPKVVGVLHVSIFADRNDVGEHEEK